jgi:hypothetical protein
LDAIFRRSAAGLKVHAPRRPRRCAAKYVGITRNPDEESYFDNMVVHCLVTIRVVKGHQNLYGACKETDKDGDYTSTTFDSEAHYFIGGTGKYKGITGEAPFTVETGYLLASVIGGSNTPTSSRPA